MAQPIYATLDELRAFTGSSSSSSITDADLREASEIIDEILLTAIYATDGNGVATDQHTREAIRDATCAQAVHADEFGTESDLAASGGGVSLGPLTLPAIAAKSGGSSGGGITYRAPRAIRILRGAGLIVGPVLT